MGARACARAGRGGACPQRQGGQGLGSRAVVHLKPPCTAGFRGLPVKIRPRGAKGPRPAPPEPGTRPATLRCRPRSKTLPTLPPATARGLEERGVPRPIEGLGSKSAPARRLRSAPQRVGRDGCGGRRRQAVVTSLADTARSRPDVPSPGSDDLGVRRTYPPPEATTSACPGCTLPRKQRPRRAPDAPSPGSDDLGVRRTYPPLEATTSACSCCRGPRWAEARFILPTAGGGRRRGGRVSWIAGGSGASRAWCPAGAVQDAAHSRRADES